MPVMTLIVLAYIVLMVLKCDNLLIQMCLLGGLSVLAIDLWRRSSALMGFDLGIGLWLQAMASVPLVQLTGALAFGFGLYRFYETLRDRLGGHITMRTLLTLTSVLIVWDVVLVALVYPTFNWQVFGRLLVPTILLNHNDIEFVPTIGSGDFLVLGFVSCLINRPLWVKVISACLAFIALPFVPVTGMLPALTVLLPVFLIGCVVASLLMELIVWRIKLKRSVKSDGGNLKW